MEPRDVAAGLAEEMEDTDRLFSASRSPIAAATVKAAPAPRCACARRVLRLGGVRDSGRRAGQPAGVIDAVDLAESSLERGRAKAALRGLSNVRFVQGDVLDRPAPRGGYDAVMCSLEVSSFPDVAAGTERLLRLLRLGGRLTVAIWSQGALEPPAELIHRAVVPERPRPPDVLRLANPLQPIGTPPLFRDWLAARSLSFIDVQHVPLTVPGDPDLLWPLVSSARFRGLLDGLPVAAVKRVRRRFTAGLLAEGRDTIDFSALVGTGTIRRVAPPRLPRSARSLLAVGRPIGPVSQVG